MVKFPSRHYQITGTIAAQVECHKGMQNYQVTSDSVT